MARTHPLRMLADPALWHTGTMLAIGCSTCQERKLCGGLSNKTAAHDCMALCCGEPESCKSNICPRKPREYVKALREVGGLELTPITRRVAKGEAIPEYIPKVPDGSRRILPLDVSVVAVSLRQLFDWKTGALRIKTPDELRHTFRLGATCRVVIDGVDKDRWLERFWSACLTHGNLEGLRALRPAMVTTPNFSMFCDRPRHDNLYSMKRIAICASCFADNGLPLAVHLNGRTEWDYHNWAKFLIESPWVSSVAFEFGTLGRSYARKCWHAAQLARLADEVDRPLDLVLRGGSEQINVLAPYFRRVVLLDSVPLMKARFRRRARISDGELKWEKSFTLAGQDLDELVAHNIKVARRHYIDQLASCRRNERMDPADACCLPRRTRTS